MVDSAATLSGSGETIDSRIPADGAPWPLEPAAAVRDVPERGGEGSHRTSMGWADLPNDVLFHVFSFMIEGRVWRLAGVCRDWRAAVNEFRPPVWVLRKSWPDAVRALRHTRKLILYLSRTKAAIPDMGLLGGLHQLCLSHTHFLTDLTPLRGVAKLDLSYCRGVTDVTPLSDASDLNLSNCPNLTDVSCLGRVRRLDLTSCPGVCSTAGLGTVHELALSGCPIEAPEPLPNVHKLTMRFCNELKRVDGLGSVTILDLTGCRWITDVSPLASVPNLTLSNCTGVTDVSMLGKCTKLNLNGAGVTDASALGKVKVLDLSRTGVRDVSMLGGVRSLSLVDMGGSLTGVPALGGVHTLDLSGNRALGDISALAWVHTLVLHEAEFTTPLSHLANVTNLRYCNW